MRAFSKYGILLSIIVMVTIFLSAERSYAASSFKEFDSVSEVNPYKEWTVEFNTKLLQSSTNHVVVKNADGEDMDVHVSVNSTKKSIKVEPPIAGYVNGETYTLIIGREVKSVDNKQLNNEVRMKFTILGAHDPSLVNTKKEVMTKWDLYKPTYEGNPFVKDPSIRAPYTTGELKQGFLQDGVNMTNFVRYLSGLPDDIELNSSLNEQGQYGAVVTAANGYLNHHPTKPTDMDKDFYEIGYKSTSSSNLSQQYTKEDFTSSYEIDGAVQKGTIASSVYSYMMDESRSNIDRVGHRRWILNPQLKDVGFGYALNKKLGNYYNYTFSTMQVFDKSREEEVDYDYIGWPGVNRYFPAEFFPSDTPWSVSLNPYLYQIPELTEVNVEIKSLADGKTHKLNTQDTPMNTDGRDVLGEYFNINNQWYGIPYCIVFRPDPDQINLYNGVYEVTVEGLKDRNGNETSLQYKVNFFDLLN
ncbi:MULTISPECIES: CAP domain-containing protein [Pontibacillus]|uniref:CAP domain-containing protein n=1 Tax=Pontibacillus chungwhensis TaxID=265426 RepID=A0ABY8UWL1_9BACI|nr:MULTISPECIES: CAP domain-containing protein [Pontibacillus]MCD5324213.1 CAP domain-containing protein [Pontibacillus sp. HN14]WIF97730.1 CAP domain-containing protein [Pontibacillus chungwhensis]